MPKALGQHNLRHDSRRLDSRFRLTPARSKRVTLQVTESGVTLYPGANRISFQLSPCVWALVVADWYLTLVSVQSFPYMAAHLSVCSMLSICRPTPRRALCRLCGIQRTGSQQHD